MGVGEFICCDSCPKVFHFMCCQPPVDPQSLPDEWWCNECRVRKVCLIFVARYAVVPILFGLLISFHPHPLYVAPRIVINRIPHYQVRPGSLSNFSIIYTGATQKRLSCRRG